MPGKGRGGGGGGGKEGREYFRGLVQLNFATLYQSQLLKSTLPSPVFQKLLRRLAQSSQNKILYHNRFSLKKDLFILVQLFFFKC